MMLVKHSPRSKRTQITSSKTDAVIAELMTERPHQKSWIETFKVPKTRKTREPLTSPKTDAVIAELMSRKPCPTWIDKLLAV